MEVIVEWANEDGQYPYETYSVIVGREAWGKQGVAVTLMSSDLRCALYTGDVFDKQIAVLVPNDADLVPAIWAYCQSPFYRDAVRRIDTSLKVTNRSLAKVPFDLAHWQQVADEMGPLPEPYSEDPTQWLFKGHPARSTAPLQVAVARLLGYRWPEQPSPPQPPSPRGEGGDDGLDALADHDGIVCLPPVGGERPGADRLRDLLAAAYGDAWTPATLDGLLADAGYGGKSLADWLRDGFFAQHCKLFHHRPFIWQVWDGRKDGFSALVNYHRLDTALLERLTYTILGDWITRQRQAMDAQEPGSDARYVAALALQEKLKLILAGEPPHDLFIRWKPLAQQPLGWDPDLNDGVRLNIRPFVEAGILRARPNIKWGKDRGKDPESAPWYPIDNGDRINDHHLTLAEKRAAREQGKA
jgi:hypothetical protein